MPEKKGYIEDDPLPPDRVREAVDVLTRALSAIATASTKTEKHRALLGLAETADKLLMQLPEPYRTAALTARAIGSAAAKEHVKVDPAGAEACADALMSGDTVRRLRLAAGLKQQELADYLHLPQSAIGRWESGTRPVPPKHVPAIRRLLDRSPAVTTA